MQLGLPAQVWSRVREIDGRAVGILGVLFEVLVTERAHFCKTAGCSGCLCLGRSSGVLKQVLVCSLA